ncbi:MAG: hypothetical protein Q9226_004083 [Calogaya cf. arnoldii]
MPTKTKKTKKTPKSKGRFTIPLPLGWRLYIPFAYLGSLCDYLGILLIVLGVTALLVQGVLAFLNPVKQITRPHPNNVPVPVPAMTTAATLSGAKDRDGESEKGGSSVMGGRTTIGGKVYRLPLTTESYVVEVRQVVVRKRAGDI